MAALLLQQARPREHVRPVARGRGRPRRRRRRTEELVHHDHRVGTARREDGEVEDALRLRRQPRGVGRLHRRADAGAEVHVPVDRLRAGGPRPLRVVGARAGDDDAGASEDRDQLGSAVVDPERLRLGKAARVGHGRPGRARRGGCGGEGANRQKRRHEIPQERPVSSRRAVVLSGAARKRRGRPRGRPRSSFCSLGSRRLRRAGRRPRGPRSPHLRRASSPRPHRRCHCRAGRRT